MSTIVQDFNFTRYIFQNSFVSHKNRNVFYFPKKMQISDFDEFVLANTIYPFGVALKQQKKLPIYITIEPFKNDNTKTKGAILYLQETTTNKDLTGLRETRYENTYYGDFYEAKASGMKNKDFVLFQVVPETMVLIVDVFYAYYPSSKKERLKLIENHQWHKKTTPVGGLKSFKTL